MRGLAAKLDNLLRCTLQRPLALSALAKWLRPLAAQGVIYSPRLVRKSFNAHARADDRAMVAKDHLHVGSNVSHGRRAPAQPVVSTSPVGPMAPMQTATRMLACT